MRMDIFGFDEIPVMKADSFDSHSAKFYRFKISDRSDDSCTTNLEIYRIDLCRYDLRRELICHCPSRVVICRSNALALIQRFYFDD